MRYAIIRILDRISWRLSLDLAREQCGREGHLWDSERPSGPLHQRDICWRCEAVRGAAS